MCSVANIVTGFAVASNTVGEQTILLKYSEKREREQNIGLFRAAYGIGGLIAPALGASMYAWGGFMATFMSVGIGYLLAAPLIYRRLFAAKEQWNLELKRIEQI